MFPIASNSDDETLYSDSVFSTTLYTGTGSTQTINNGIDLAGKGGLVWVKSRSTDATYGGAHQLVDTVRGLTASSGSSVLATDIADSSSGSNGYSAANQGFASFNAAGFSLNAVAATVYSGSTNTNNVTYASWTFRKAAKFFDVVTYTGNGSTDRVLSHSLGVTAGMIVVKCTSNAGSWYVWQRTYASLTDGFLMLNATNAYNTSPAMWGSTPQSASTFTVSSNGNMNSTGVSYVAYLFAHDTSSTGIIQCGSFTGTGNATVGTVNLGWEPQFLIFKNTVSGSTSWEMRDSMRGLCNPSTTISPLLYANLADAETTNNTIGVTATGFEHNYQGAVPYIYMAIRMPNKPPTSGTQVYNAIARTGTGAAATITGVGFAPDLILNKTRTLTWEPVIYDKIRGVSNVLYTSATVSEQVQPGIERFYMDGFQVGTFRNVNAVDAIIHHCFKRAPGFFDEVCYTGTGVATTQTHNLTVAPELMIVKRRSSAGPWQTYDSFNGGTKTMYLADTIAAFEQANIWNNAAPTATVFSIGINSNVNASGSTYVAYLFATLAGISKVGSYTGNGGTQNIECGFATGARFVLVKATSTTGDWLVADTARGIVTGNDPHLSLNSTASEVTTDDSIDPYSAGFTVNQVAATNINVSSATYIFLAIS